MVEDTRHPFLQGLSKHRGAPPTILVIFGASGDLCARKLVPAIFNLAVDNLLSPDFYLIGFGRKPIPDDAFRTETVKDIKQFSRRPLMDDVWSRVQANTFYVPGGYDDINAFKTLGQKIDSIEKTLGRDLQCVFYISTPPTVFKPVLE